jgi:hypothetical protein
MDDIIEVIIFVVVFAVVIIGNLIGFAKKMKGKGGFDLEKFFQNLSQQGGNAKASSGKVIKVQAQQTQQPQDEFPQEMPEDAKEFFRNLKRQEEEDAEFFGPEAAEVNVQTEFETVEAANVPDIPPPRVLIGIERADHYGEFIRNNGKCAIVLSEILGPPKALR